jgi:hypothetical protein
MLAVIKKGIDPGQPRYITSKQFEAIYTKELGNFIVCLQPDGVNWSQYGIIGSKWIIEDIIYIKVKDEKDDPFQYYTVPEIEKRNNEPSWARPKNKSKCGSGGCGSGSCP